MCHTIFPFYHLGVSGVYLECNDTIFAGIKILDHNRGVLRPYYIPIDYYEYCKARIEVNIHEEISYSAIEVTHRNAPAMQEVGLEIKVVSSNTKRETPTTTYIPVFHKCGMHIYPLGFWDKEKYEAKRHKRNGVIVLFHRNDILFYDGKDVSVSKFYITSNSTLYKIFGKEVIKRFKHIESVLKRTGKLYKSLRKSLRRCKNEKRI